MGEIHEKQVKDSAKLGAELFKGHESTRKSEEGKAARYADFLSETGASTSTHKVKKAK